MLQPPGFYFVKKTKRFVILSSDKSSECNLSSFFDIKKPRIYRVKNPSHQIRILIKVRFLSKKLAELSIQKRNNARTSTLRKNQNRNLTKNV